MELKIIAAVSKNGIIGDRTSNNIPWMGKYPQDMKYFRQMTANSEVIMGRRTFESMGSKPLPKRQNVVITRASKIDGVSCFLSLSKYVNNRKLILEDAISNKWVIGGEGIYREALQLPETKEIYLTLIPEVVQLEHPVYFPWIDPSQFKVSDCIILEDALMVVHYVRV